LSGASQSVYPSCSPKAYPNPWSFPPNDSTHDEAAPPPPVRKPPRVPGLERLLGAPRKRAG
jgi:hypothetical protein